MNDDPIVAEVRKIRAILTRECGNDIHKMLAKDREFFRRWKGKKITVPFHSEWQPPELVSNMALAEEKAEYGSHHRTSRKAMRQS